MTTAGLVGLARIQHQTQEGLEKIGDGVDSKSKDTIQAGIDSILNTVQALIPTDGTFDPAILGDEADKEASKIRSFYTGLFQAGTKLGKGRRSLTDKDEIAAYEDGKKGRVILESLAKEDKDAMKKLKNGVMKGLKQLIPPPKLRVVTDENTAESGPKEATGAELLEALRSNDFPANFSKDERDINSGFTSHMLGRLESEYGIKGIVSETSKPSTKASLLSQSETVFDMNAAQLKIVGLLNTIESGASKQEIQNYMADHINTDPAALTILHASQNAVKDKKTSTATSFDELFKSEEQLNAFAESFVNVVSDEKMAQFIENNPAVDPNRNIDRTVQISGELQRVIEMGGGEDEIKQMIMHYNLSTQDIKAITEYSGKLGEKLEQGINDKKSGIWGKLSELKDTLLTPKTMMVIKLAMPAIGFLINSLGSMGIPGCKTLAKAVMGLGNYVASALKDANEVNLYKTNVDQEERAKSA